MAGQSAVGFKKGRSQEYYSPHEVLLHLYVANGYRQLDLDPCSPCHGEEAPTFPWIKKHYTAKDNSLTLPWKGRVYCNPPYGAIADFIEKGWDEVACGNAECVIFLVPYRIDQPWHHRFIHFHRCPTIRINRRSMQFTEPSPEYIARHGLDVPETALERIIERTKKGKTVGTIPEAMQLIFMGNFRPFTDYFQTLPRRELAIYKTVDGMKEWYGEMDDTTLDYSKCHPPVVSLVRSLCKLDRENWFGAEEDGPAKAKATPGYGDELFHSDRTRKKLFKTYLETLRDSILETEPAPAKPTFEVDRHGCVKGSWNP